MILNLEATCSSVAISMPRVNGSHSEELGLMLRGATFCAHEIAQRCRQTPLHASTLELTEMDMAKDLYTLTRVPE